MVCGLTLGFSAVVATLETLRLQPSGFAFEVTWRTFVALLVAGLVVLPCFRVIFHSQHKAPRRVALATVILIGVGAFFYPLRFVPREKLGDILAGLGFAAIALAATGGCLLWVRHFFEADEKSQS